MNVGAEARFEVVVFDWDGTLMDSTHAITHAIRQSAADLGLPIPPVERARHVIGLGLLEAIHMAVPEVQREQVPAFIERYRMHYLARDAQLQPFDGIPGLLIELAATGTMLAVATGKSRVGLNRALVTTGWGRHFVTTRCADEGAPKPDPWMLRDICEELGLDASSAVMVGDTTHDLGMANAAGAPGVAVTYGAHGEGELAAFEPAAIVSSVPALRDWLLPRVRPYGSAPHGRRDGAGR